MLLRPQYVFCVFIVAVSSGKSYEIYKGPKQIDIKTVGNENCNLYENIINTNGKNAIREVLYTMKRFCNSICVFTQRVNS